MVLGFILSFWLLLQVLISTRDISFPPGRVAGPDHEVGKPGDGDDDYVYS